MGTMLKHPELTEEQKRFMHETKEMLELDETSGGAEVIITEDMSMEEEEFELIAGFIKEGKSLEEAKEKTNELMATMKQLGWYNP